MSTSKSFITFFEDCLSHISGIKTKAMFGEYALYKDGKVVWLICDDTFFLKITPNTTTILWEIHPTGFPYPWAKPQYIIEEDILEDREKTKELIEKCAENIAVPKKKTPKK